MNKKSVSTPENWLVAASSLEPKECKWLFPGYIPAGSIVIIEGDPGLGKSTVTIDLTARLSRGHQLPFATGPEKPPCNVLMLNAEDDIDHTVRPRLQAADADLSRVLLFSRDAEIDLSEKGINILEQYVRKHDAAVIVIDPLMAFFPIGINTHKDSDVRRTMKRLRRLCEVNGVTAVLVRHLNKSTEAKAVYRGGGSIGITGAARAAYLVEKHPKDPGLRVFACVKLNVGKEPSSLMFEVRDCAEHKSSNIAWLGNTTLSADVLTLGLPKGPSEVERAAEFLHTRLDEGPVRVVHIRRDAQHEGLSWASIRRAAKEIGVKQRRQGFGPGGHHEWSLPGADCPPDLSTHGEREPSDDDDSNEPQLTLDDEEEA